MQIRNVLREFDIKPRKRLGQNFLVSKYYLNKIVETIDCNSNDVVVEIGAGIGNLTELISKRVKKVIAVEKDKKLSQVLKQIFRNENKISILEKDFLKINLADLYKSEDKPLKIFGNPPYYLSSELIKKLINEREYFREAYISLQKEYVERIFASCNTAAYGRLTVFVQTHLDIEYLFKIPRNAFFPMPDVDSVFIFLRPKKNVDVRDKEVLNVLTGEFFQRRRKKIRTIMKMSSVLKKLNIERTVKLLNIDLDKRPQELTLNEYAMLSNLIKKER